MNLYFVPLSVVPNTNKRQYFISCVPFRANIYNIIQRETSQCRCNWQSYRQLSTIAFRKITLLTYCSCLSRRRVAQLRCFCITKRLAAACGHAGRKNWQLYCTLIQISPERQHTTSSIPVPGLRVTTDERQPLPPIRRGYLTSWPIARVRGRDV